MVAIRKAAVGDMDAIYRVAERSRLEIAGSEGGFLVSGFSEDHYSKFITAGRRVMFLVAVDGEDRIAGFLFGYTSDYVSNLPVHTSEDKIFELLGPKSRFFVIKQIAVHPDFRRQGVAQALYRSVLSDLAKTRTVPHIFATIVTAPRNLASEAFHKDLGFRPVLTHSPDLEDDTKRLTFEIYYLSAHAIPNVNKLESDLLQAHATSSENLWQAYRTALELYRHEDQLNWTKKLALITLALSALAALWFISIENPSVGRTIALSVILAGGLLGIVSYTLQLRSGLRFFRKHKEAARLLEAILVRERLLSVPLLLRVPREATTAKLIDFLPMVLLIVWVIISVVIVFRDLW